LGFQFFLTNSIFSFGFCISQLAPFCIHCPTFQLFWLTMFSSFDFIHCWTFQKFSSILHIWKSQLFWNTKEWYSFLHHIWTSITSIQRVNPEPIYHKSFISKISNLGIIKLSTIKLSKILNNAVIWALNHITQ